jgi:hypothetical protein
MQTVRSNLSGIKKMKFIFYCGKFVLKILSEFLNKFLYFPFRTLTLYTILYPSKNFPCKIFTVYCNKHNQHSLSLTTLTVTHNTHCHSQHSLSLTTLTVTHNTHPFRRSTNTHSAIIFAASLNNSISSPIHMTEDS